MTAMSAAQKKVIDDHCTTEWAGKFADPWADFEHAGSPRSRPMPGHEVYTITAAQLDEWKKSAEPLEKQWADDVRKAGGDPDAIMKELKAVARPVQGGRIDPTPRCAGSTRTRAKPAMRPLAAAVGDRDEPASVQPQPMDRFIDGIELIAAFFVGIVAADIFISVLLRYFFSIQIPDSYDFGRLLLGILIFWGIAATSLPRHAHHRRSGVRQCRPEAAQRVIDVFATLVLLFVVTVQT